MQFFNIEFIAFEIWEYPISYVELIGTVFGLISVYLASQANILTWPTGIINELCLFILFFQVQLYADMFLQVFFFVVTLYGWYHWGEKKEDKDISEISFNARLLLGFLIVLGTAVFGSLFGNLHILLPAYFTEPAAFPFVDSLVMVLSIIATILLARKKVESWILWILVDIISTVLFAAKGIYFLALEYAIFLGLATYGYFKWRKLMKHA